MDQGELFQGGEPACRVVGQPDVEASDVNLKRAGTAPTLERLKANQAGDAHVLTVEDGECEGRYVLFYGDENYGGEPLFSNQYTSHFSAPSVVLDQTETGPDRDYFCVEQYLMAEKARFYTLPKVNSDEVLRHEYGLLADAIMAINPHDEHPYGMWPEAPRLEKTARPIGFGDFVAADEDPSSAMATKLLGSCVHVDHQWFGIQERVLKAGVLAKFGQNPKLADVLAATRGMIIAEGPCRNYGLGAPFDDWLDEVRSDKLTYARRALEAHPQHDDAKNILGRVLMAVREELP